MCIYSQDYLNSELLDSVVEANYSYRKNETLKSIAKQLHLENTSSEKFQYAVLAKWVVNRMYYDNSASKSQLKKSIRTGQGVCWQYSEIMDSLSYYCGIEKEYVRGYIKDGIDKKGKIYFENHAWNVALLDGEYLMSDVTWSDSGKSKKEKKSNLNFNYLLVSPEEFALTHFPRKKKHLHTSGTKKCFKSQPIYLGGYWLFETDDNGLNIDLIYQKDSLCFTVTNASVDIDGFELYYSSNDEVFECEEYSEARVVELTSGFQKYSFDLSNASEYEGSCTLVILYRFNNELRGTSVMEFYIK